MHLPSLACKGKLNILEEMTFSVKLVEGDCMLATYLREDRLDVSGLQCKSFFPVHVLYMPMGNELKWLLKKGGWVYF